MLNRLSFTNKIILAASLVLILALGAQSFRDYWSTEKHVSSNLQSSINEIGHAAAANIENWLNNKVHIIEGLAKAAAGNTSTAEIQPHVIQAFNASPFEYTYVGLEDGTFIPNDPNDPVPEDYDPRKRPWYELAKSSGKPALTEPYSDADLHALLLSAVAPINQGGFRGVAAGDLNLTTISDIVNQIRFLGLGYAFLATEEGKILAHPDNSFVEKKVEDLLGQNLDINTATLHEVDTPAGNKLVAFVPIQNLPSVHWHLGIVLDRDLAYASLDSMRFSAIVFVIIGTIATVILLNLLINFLMRPVKRLNQAMDNMASGDGDLTHRIDVDSDDEIGALGKSFNTFVDKIHQLIKQVVGVIDQLDSSVHKMTKIAHESERAADKQRGETDMVATAINQMSAAAHEIAENAQNAAEAARDADTESQQARLVVEKNLYSIQHLADEIDRAATVINALEADVSNIVSVLDVIRGVAEQTNLLALNAAIEAARAGDAGRGFAVVADEVRTLASRTQQSTQEIQTMIERLQQGSDQAVMVMQSSRQVGEDTVAQGDHVKHSLNTIAQAVATITDMNVQIASASEEQTAVTEGINRSIASIAEESEHTAQASRETATNSETLAMLEERLRETVGRFRV